MTLPTKQQLSDRQKQTEDRKKHLEQSYQTFISAWNDIAHEQDALLRELSTYDDKQKMHDILKHINTIK